PRERLVAAGPGREPPRGRARGGGRDRTRAVHEGLGARGRHALLFAVLKERMPRRSPAVTAWLVAALAVAPRSGRAAEAAPPLAWSPGPPPVGFRVVDYGDSERHMPDGSLRPIQASLWYPARQAGAPAMRYRDYVLLTARERTLAAPDARQESDALAAYRAFLGRNGLSA